MTTERLFEFLVLSQTLSFSAAAKKLFMTQSALSRHIAELENELGIKVLERSTHSVRLTPEGRMLASRIPRLIEKSETAVSRLRLAAAQTSGSVAIASLENTIHDQLVIFLNYFSGKYPDIDFNIDVLSRSDRVGVFESYDLSFTGFELQKLPDHISVSPAFRSPAVLCAPEKHRLFTNYHVRLEELVGETLIVPYADDVFCSYAAMRQLAEKSTGYGLSIVKVPNVESALAMVFFGKGLAILPQYLSQNSLLNIWGVDISTPGCAFDTYVYHNESRNNSAAELMLMELKMFVEGAAAP